MSFADFGVQRGATIPDHNRLRGRDVGDPHPTKADVNHVHQAAPLGVLGYAEITASVPGLTNGSDITGLTKAVSAGTSRRLRITVHVQTATSATSEWAIEVQEGATVVGRAGFHTSQSGASTAVSDGSVVVTASGDHTYKATVVRSTGSGTIDAQASATTPAFLLVEDVGAA